MCTSETKPEFVRPEENTQTTTRRQNRDKEHHQRTRPVCSIDQLDPGAQSTRSEDAPERKHDLKNTCFNFSVLTLCGHSRSIRKLWSVRCRHTSRDNPDRLVHLKAEDATSVSSERRAEVSKEKRGRTGLREPETSAPEARAPRHKGIVRGHEVVGGLIHRQVGRRAAATFAPG